MRKKRDSPEVRERRLSHKRIRKERDCPEGVWRKKEEIK